MATKEGLGTRYECFSCGVKFYDLNRPVPTCPDCSTDQREAPARDIKSLLSRSSSAAPETELTEDDLLGGLEKDEEEEDADGGEETPADEAEEDIG